MTAEPIVSIIIALVAVIAPQAGLSQQQPQQQQVASGVASAGTPSIAEHVPAGEGLAFRRMGGEGRCTAAVPQPRRAGCVHRERR